MIQLLIIVRHVHCATYEVNMFDINEIHWTQFDLIG